MTIEAYCLKCKTTRTITDAEEHVNVRGTHMAQGLCPICGTKVTTFLPKVEAPSAPKAATTAGRSDAPQANPAPPSNPPGTAAAPSAPAVKAKRGAKKGA